MKVSMDYEKEWYALKKYLKGKKYINPSNEVELEDNRILDSIMTFMERRETAKECIVHYNTFFITEEEYNEYGISRLYKTRLGNESNPEWLKLINTGVKWDYKVTSAFSVSRQNHHTELMSANQILNNLGVDISDSLTFSNIPGIEITKLNKSIFAIDINIDQLPTTNTHVNTKSDLKDTVDSYAASGLCSTGRWR